MLANADDARATTFTVLLDKAHYITQGLLSDHMQDMQAAALLVGNDTVFSEQDYLGYTRKIGDSHKANDSRTVGQFGKGAMTAYSLSDTIQLLSGDDIMFLDPHATRLPNQAPSLRGNLVDPDSHRYVDIQQEAPSQMEPFISATCPSLPPYTVGTHYPGTLFRLALRTPEAATTSRISQKALSADDFLASTLKEFCKLAPELLLFTRSISIISVWVKESADKNAELLHECVSSKQRFPSSANDQLPVQQLTVKAWDTNVAHTRAWAVATSLASAGGTDGVAALLNFTAEGPVSFAARCPVPKVHHLPPLQGKVYATMPLPFNVSGLPMHMNGAFWMGSDRRKLWSGEGDEGKVRGAACLSYVTARSVCIIPSFDCVLVSAQGKMSCNPLWAASCVAGCAC